jgi:hypothetical protein
MHAAGIFSESFLKESISGYKAFQGSVGDSTLPFTL